MTARYLLLQIAVMAGVTYLVRMLPLAVFRKKIENPLLKSFLYYIPYAVLAAMTFPAVFTATGGGIWSALAGLVTALVLAFFEKSLLTVALCACVAVLAAEGVLALF